MSDSEPDYELRVGALQRELASMRSARRGAYRIVYEIAETEQLIIVDRIEHRSTAYRPR